MFIKVQKILMFIPIINIIPAFCWIIVGFKQVMKAMATNSVNSLKGGLKGVLYEFGISSVTNFGSNIFSESIARGWFGR